ncbi:MAG: hypothetical protein Q8O39_00955, partial [bacterium]|nr:hypothetical protein [bacterium]
EINFFYKNKPPLKIIKKINDLMGTNIEPWNFNYWLNFYEGYNLEKYYIFTDNIKTTNQQKIKNYCMKMVADKNYNTKIKKEIIKKLINIMFLFNENNKHLAYGIFILRKRPNKEQVSLFGA